MVKYLFILFDISQDCGPSSAFLDTMLSKWPELSPCLYLDNDNSKAETTKYNHANIYRIQDNQGSKLSEIDEHLQSYGDLINYHWQLLDEISGLRQSAISTISTVVTVGMTIPENEDSEKELNRWYDQEHIPALAAVPGWLAGIRVKLLDSSNTEDPAAAPYLAIHEWGKSSGLGSEAWKKAVMTPWTERITKMHTAPVYRRVWKIRA